MHEHTQRDTHFERLARLEGKGESSVMKGRKESGETEGEGKRSAHAQTRMAPPPSGDVHGNV